MDKPTWSPLRNQPETGTLPSGRLRRVTEYIRQNLDRELPLAELAALVYMSPYHFARLFKRSTGVPPHRFVIRQRIVHARAILATRGLSVAQISRMGGISDAESLQRGVPQGHGPHAQPIPNRVFARRAARTGRRLKWTAMRSS